MSTFSSTFVPNIYKKSTTESTEKLSSEVVTYINSRVNSQVNSEVESNIKPFIQSQLEKKLAEIEPKYEIFEQEDIRPNYSTLIQELQNRVDNCLKKTGDTMNGPLHILKISQGKFDAVNKEYVDWLISTINEKLDTKYNKNSDLDLHHFKIKNLQSPTNLTDAATKSYVDEQFEKFGFTRPLHHLFSKGQVIAKKTFFFNPGFICPKQIHITSVGFATTPYKYKIGEQNKLGTINPTKLYFMVNNEIKSEYVIEKNVQLGYILKEFEDPIIFEKGDNVMMIIESAIEDTSVNITFY
jgi:hypothetical protein